MIVSETIVAERLPSVSSAEGQSWRVQIYRRLRGENIYDIFDDNTGHRLLTTGNINVWVVVGTSWKNSEIIIKLNVN